MISFNISYYSLISKLYCCLSAMNFEILGDRIVYYVIEEKRLSSGKFYKVDDLLNDEIYFLNDI